MTRFFGLQFGSRDEGDPRVRSRIMNSERVDADLKAVPSLGALPKPRPLA